jgi:hypothetical protein
MEKEKNEPVISNCKKEKMMTTREKRHEIYDLLEKRLGAVDKTTRSLLSEKLQELVQIHNETLVSLNNSIQDKHKETLASLYSLEKENKEIKKLNKTLEKKTSKGYGFPSDNFTKKNRDKIKPFFNGDFMNKYSVPKPHFELPKQAPVDQDLVLE